MSKEKNDHSSAETTTLLTSLIAAAADGDSSAKSRLYDLVKQQLRVIAINRLAKQPCRDMRQTHLIDEAFMRLFRPNNGMDCRHRGDFFALAKRVMWQIIVEELRRTKTHRELPSEITDAPADQGLSILVDEMMTRLKARNVRQESIVRMHYLQQWKIVEIAKKLEISYSTAKADLALGKQWLLREFSQG